jgi:hypothetical protein
VSTPAEGLTPAEAMQTLFNFAEELNRLSGDLARVSRDLEPIQRQYEQFVADFEIGLWQQHQDTGAKLPAAALRVRLAEKAMDPALLGRYTGLVHSRERLQQRIRDVKQMVEAQRSILSALKAELEATT